MKTEIQFSIIYPSHTENDVNQFEFFIRMAPADGKNIISVLHFCVNSEQSLESQNILMIISQLVQLEEIVKDINLSTKDAENRLRELMVSIIDRYGKE